MYLIRLDDASEYMNTEKWLKMENLLNKYDIKPIFGIIPLNHDESMLSQYKFNEEFWDFAQKWILNGWTPALHGFEHKYVTDCGGINPVHKRSEFAGLKYEVQAEKIKNGYKILAEHNIKPEIFFAPSHTFDENTLMALEDETPIRVISDTVANDVYKHGSFYFIPQQSGAVRKLPFKTVTFCYHPNIMNETGFLRLEEFFKKYKNYFTNYSDKLLQDRERSFYDKALEKLYFTIRRFRR